MRFFKFLSVRGSSHSARSVAKPPRPRAVLQVEQLEDRCLPSVISGFVYNDLNHNGIFDSGEPVITGNKIELLDSTGALVATATTDSTGHYAFTYDPRINTAP